MATKGIKLRDKDNNIVLPVTSSDLVEVKYAGSSQILTNVLEQNEQVTAEALNDLNNRLLNVPSKDHTHVFYGVCDTDSSTASKLVIVPDFAVKNGVIITIKFTNTNFATSLPVLRLNTNNTTYPMYRMLDEEQIRITGAFIQAGYEYTFVFNNNAFYLLNSTFQTNDVIEICVTDLVWSGSGQEPSQQSYINSNQYRVFGFVQNNKKFNGLLANYKTILTCVADLNYITMLYGSDYDYTSSATGFTTSAFSSWKSYVSVSACHDYDYLYVNYIDPTNEIQNTMFGGSEPISVPNVRASFYLSGDSKTCTGSTYMKITYHTYIDFAQPSNIVDNRDQKIGNIRYDSSEIDDAEIIHVTMPSGNNSMFRITSSPGLFLPCPKQRINNTVFVKTQNVTNSNVTVTKYAKNMSETLDNDSTYTMLRYETPLFRLVENYERPNSSIRYENRYYRSYEGCILNAYNVGSAATSYAQCIIGNNYCEMSYGGDHDGGEMFFYNGVTMRNYISAYIDGMDVSTKILKQDTTLQFGDWRQDASTTAHLKISDDDGIRYEHNAGQTNTVQYSALGKHYVTTQTLNVNRHDGQNSGSIILSATSGSTFNSQTTFSVTYAQKYFETSDEQIKHDITCITNSDINIYSFIKNDSDKYSYGFIAQNVAKTHPELVTKTETSYFSVDYNSTLSLLLARAMNRIDELEERIKKLEQRHDA